MNEHEPNCYYAGYVFCAKCGMRMAGFVAEEECPVMPDGSVPEPPTDPLGKALGEAVRESAFDRLDRQFKNK